METGFLADIIKEMLVRGEVACLPGFGAFTTEQVPAYFSDKGFTINPPYLKPVFDERVTDDLALVDFYAGNNGLTRSRAMDIVTQEVASIRGELTGSRIVLLPGLGYLRMPHDGRVIFIAEEGLQIFPHYDFLEPVSLRYLDAADFVAKMKSDDREAPTHATVPEPDSVLVLGDVAKPEYDVKPAQNIRKHGGASRAAVISIMFAVLVAVLALAALAVLGRTCPELVDPLLYNAEELEILNARI